MIISRRDKAETDSHDVENLVQVLSAHGGIEVQQLSN